MRTRALNALAGVICAAQTQDRTPMGIAFAIESAGLLNSPEHAAEVEQLRNDLTGACLARWEEEQDAKRARFAAKLARQRAAKLRTRIAELEAAVGAGSTRTVDEDPIAYSLTPEAMQVSSGSVIELPPRPADVSRQVQSLRGLLARQRAAVEDPNGLHHDYRLGRDLPEVQG
ncbi:hypothetical protein ABZ070_19375 [Streptomyces sp. NPDC006283]|uniref:hypothetical protein n=1 Tax=Streptomyces sp. NPDC006283 TaxID=3156741 RepID=UPI0033AC7FFE